MKKFINEYIAKRNRENLLDIDLHEITQLKELGLNDSEIGKELSVSKEYANEILKQLEKEI